MPIAEEKPVTRVDLLGFGNLNQPDTLWELTLGQPTPGKKRSNQLLKPCRKGLVAFRKRHSKVRLIPSKLLDIHRSRVTRRSYLLFPFGAPTIENFLTSMYELQKFDMVGCEFTGFKSWISTWWFTERFHSNLWSLWDFVVKFESFRVANPSGSWMISEN